MKKLAALGAAVLLLALVGYSSTGPHKDGGVRVQAEAQTPVTAQPAIQDPTIVPTVIRTTVPTTIAPTTSTTQPVAKTPSNPPKTTGPPTLGPLTVQTSATTAPRSGAVLGVRPPPATARAKRVQTKQVGPTLPPPMQWFQDPPGWARCPQWWFAAALAGWGEGQMPVLDYIMRRESGCNPNAYNPSGATGLTQLLGWSCPPNGCRDPWSNLHEAHVLWLSSGWCPWILRGDPVTGRACG